MPLVRKLSFTENGQRIGEISGGQRLNVAPHEVVKGIKPRRAGTAGRAGLGRFYRNLNHGKLKPLKVVTMALGGSIVMAVAQ